MENEKYERFEVTMLMKNGDVVVERMQSFMLDMFIFSMAVHKPVSVAGYEINGDEIDTINIRTLKEE